jgi:hypothetical protein
MIYSSAGRLSRSEDRRQLCRVIAMRNCQKAILDISRYPE